MIDSTPRITLRTLKTLFFSVITGAVLFGSVVVLMHDGQLDLSVPKDDPLFLALLFLCLAAIPVSRLIPNLLLKQLAAESPLKSKLAMYQKVLIMRLAMWDAPALLGLVVCMMSGNWMPLLVSLICLVYMSRFYPSSENIRDTLGLSEAEYRELQSSWAK